MVREYVGRAFKDGIVVNCSATGAKMIVGQFIRCGCHLRLNRSQEFNALRDAAIVKTDFNGG